VKGGKKIRRMKGRGKKEKTWQTIRNNALSYSR